MTNNKFPNGYEVEVLTKDDIIKSLDDDVDKELLSIIIDQCNADIVKFLEEERWTGIPFFGNIRIPKRVKKLQSDKVQNLIKDAKQTLTLSKYKEFRKELANDIRNEEKEETHYNYVISKFVKKNAKFYKYLVEVYGIDLAKLKCWFIINDGLTISRNNQEE